MKKLIIVAILAYTPTAFAWNWLNPLTPSIAIHSTEAKVTKAIGLPEDKIAGTFVKSANGLVNSSKNKTNTGKAGNTGNFDMNACINARVAAQSKALNHVDYSQAQKDCEAQNIPNEANQEAQRLIQKGLDPKDSVTFITQCRQQNMYKFGYRGVSQNGYSSENKVSTFCNQVLQAALNSGKTSTALVSEESFLANYSNLLNQAQSMGKADQMSVLKAEYDSNYEKARGQALTGDSKGLASTLALLSQERASMEQLVVGTVSPLNSTAAPIQSARGMAYNSIMNGNQNNENNGQSNAIMEAGSNSGNSINLRPSAEPSN